MLPETVIQASAFLANIKWTAGKGNAVYRAHSTQCEFIFVFNISLLGYSLKSHPWLPFIKIVIFSGPQTLQEHHIFWQHFSNCGLSYAGMEPPHASLVPHFSVSLALSYFAPTLPLRLTGHNRKARCFQPVNLPSKTFVHRVGAWLFQGHTKRHVREIARFLILSEPRSREDCPLSRGSYFEQRCELHSSNLRSRNVRWPLLGSPYVKLICKVCRNNEHNFSCAPQQ